MKTLIRVLLLGLPALGCSGEIRLTPSPGEQRHLDAHVEAVFTDVKEKDTAQLRADRQRVSDVHQIAYLAERYHEETGHYPFAEPDSSVFLQTLIGEHIGRTDGFGETYVSQEVLLADLRAVLGPEVELPRDPLPDEDGTRTYSYGVYGRSYTAAVMLYHPVGWSEGILPRRWQYRVGAYESLELPVLQAAKLLDGGYASTQPARWRDPSMASEED